ncbi:hypothetical protein F5Y04DRAFT_287666 [Hypomontagnella monticulosa]|nr:hypothetical protein F5Y04DRAFT_287666 [Hypomontagnella monticulosa]
MATESKSTSFIPPLLTLPIELIRRVGRENCTPEDQLNFSRMNRRLQSIIDLVELVKKDSEYQQSIAPESVKRVRKDPCTFRLTFGKSKKEYAISLYKPPIITVISSFKDIEIVQQCIDLYQKHFPGGLEGKWYPKLPPKCLKVFSEKFPSPAVVAAIIGRVDVVQALASSGVNLNGRGIHRSDPQRDLDYYYSPEEDPFAVACKCRHEHVAKCLISSGMTLRPYDLTHAIKARSINILEELLKHPSINGNWEFQKYLGHMTVKLLDMPRKVGAGFILRAIDLLGQYASDEWFDKAEWLHQSIIEALRSDKLPLAMDLLNSYMESANPPLEADTILRRAVLSDKFLEVTKLILSGHPWVLNDPKSIKCALNDAVDISRSPATAQYIASLGHKFGPPHLERAIRMNQHRMIDIIATNNIADPEQIVRELTPMPLVWADGPYLYRRSRTGYFTTFRALYYGADYSGMDRHQKNHFLNDLQWDEDLVEYHRMGHVQTLKPSRQSFARILPYRKLGVDEDPERYKRFETDTQAYVEQLDAAARLILGNYYWQRLKRRVPNLYAVRGKRLKDHRPLYNSESKNEIFGLPVLPSPHWTDQATAFWRPWLYDN